MEKRVLTYDMKLSKLELVHLRDLMSVHIPTDDSYCTMSSVLADAEDRVLVEEELWKKVTAACKLANIALEESAPDYVVAPIAPPPMTVCRVQQDSDVSCVDDDGCCVPTQQHDEGGMKPLKGIVERIFYPEKEEKKPDVKTEEAVSPAAETNKEDVENDGQEVRCGAGDLCCVKQTDEGCPVPCDGGKCKKDVKNGLRRVQSSRGKKRKAGRPKANRG